MLADIRQQDHASSLHCASRKAPSVVGDFPFSKSLSRYIIVASQRARLRFPSAIFLATMSSDHYNSHDAFPQSPGLTAFRPKPTPSPTPPPECSAKRKPNLHKLTIPQPSDLPSQLEPGESPPSAARDLSIASLSPASDLDSNVESLANFSEIEQRDPFWRSGNQIVFLSGRQPLQASDKLPSQSCPEQLPLSVARELSIVPLSPGSAPPFQTQYLK